MTDTVVGRRELLLGDEAVALAAIGDVTRPEVRAQAFTITGMTIGIAFMVGVLAGPMLAPTLGLKGLFFLLAGLSAIGAFCRQVFPQHSAFSKTHRTAFGFLLEQAGILKGLLG